MGQGNISNITLFYARSYVDQGKFCIQKPADSIVLSDEFYLVSLYFAHLWGGAIGVGELCG